MAGRKSEERKKLVHEEGVWIVGVSEEARGGNRCIDGGSRFSQKVWAAPLL